MNDLNPSGLGAVGEVPQAATPPPSPPLSIPIAVASPALLQRVDAVLAKLDAAAKAEEAKAASLVKKYWPMAVGVLIAATRFIHL
jgi:hypothetical protein